MKSLKRLWQNLTENTTESQGRDQHRPSASHVSASEPATAKVSYRWILPNQLAVGPIPNPISHPQLLAAGFKSVLTLCGETEGELPVAVTQDFRWKQLVLPDSHYQDQMQVEALAEAIAFVHQAITQKAAPIYVHCLAGMERSPTVCVSYLCVYQGLEVWEALNWVKQSNPRTSLTPSQVQVIQKLVKWHAQQKISAA